MEALIKLEHTIGKVFKQIPSLPAGGRKWLGDNVWWIVLVGAILSGIGTLFLIGGIFTLLALINGYASAFYVDSSSLQIQLLGAIVTIAYAVGQTVLLAIAIKPLQLKQKKGWVLLFISFLVSIIYALVSAVLTFSVLGFIGTIIFNAIGLAIGGYFLYQIHGEFAHVEKSAGVKNPVKPAAVK